MNEPKCTSELRPSWRRPPPWSLLLLLTEAEDLSVPPHARTHTHAHVHSMHTHVPHTHMHTHTHAHMHTLRLRTARDFLEVGGTGVAEGAWHR